MTSFSLNWKDADLMGDYLLDEELVGRSQAEGSGQRVDVQKVTGDKWCPSGVCIGTSAV